MKNLTLSHEALISLMRENVKGTSIVSVDLDSDMDGKGKMRKTGNSYVGKGLVHRMTLTGVIGYIYVNAVNRLPGKEGKEERDAKPHPWGDMDTQHLFRIHRKTGEAYLSMKVQNTTVHGYFLPDGTQVENSIIEPFLPPDSPKSSTQSDLDGEVIARDFALRTIQAIRGLGLNIKVVHSLPTPIAPRPILPTIQIAPAPIPAPIPATAAACTPLCTPRLAATSAAAITSRRATGRSALGWLVSGGGGSSSGSGSGRPAPTTHRPCQARCQARNRP
jgi:hypothetical protein